MVLGALFESNCLCLCQVFDEKQNERHQITFTMISKNVLGLEYKVPIPHIKVNYRSTTLPKHMAHIQKEYWGDGFGANYKSVEK